VPEFLAIINNQSMLYFQTFKAGVSQREQWHSYTGACAPPSDFWARKDATHVILRDDLSQHNHAAVNMKKSLPKWPFSL